MLQNDQEKPLKIFTLSTKSYKAAYIASFPVISEYLIINIRAVLAAWDREANIPVYSWADTDLCALKKMQLLPGMPGQTLCCSGVCGSGSVTLFPGWVPTGSQPLFSWGSQMLGQESRAQGMLPHWAAPSLVSWGKGYRSLLALLCSSCSFWETSHCSWICYHRNGTPKNLSCRFQSGWEKKDVTRPESGKGYIMVSPY